LSDVAQNNLAKLVLLGPETTIRAKAKELGVNPETFRIVDPETSDQLEEYARIYGEMRAQKGKPVSAQEAIKTMKDPLYYGAMMVHQGEVDGTASMGGAARQERDGLGGYKCPAGILHRVKEWYSNRSSKCLDNPLGDQDERNDYADRQEDHDAPDKEHPEITDRGCRSSREAVNEGTQG
jgi:hypothetical protein